MDRFSFRAAVHIAQAEFRQWLRSSRIIILFVMLVFVNVQVIGRFDSAKCLWEKCFLYLRLLWLWEIRELSFL